MSQSFKYYTDRLSLSLLLDRIHDDDDLEDSALKELNAESDLYTDDDDNFEINVFLDPQEDHKLVLTSLNPIVFHHKQNINEIDISDNELAYVASNAFTGLSSLEKVDLRENSIKFLDPKVFCELSTLKSINMSYNNIRSLDASIFNGLRNLNKLNFSNNKLTKLDASLFANLTKLLEINFESNYITELVPELFSDLVNLKRVNFSSNTLTYLDNIFKNNQKLKCVSLKFNQIKLNKAIKNNWKNIFNR